MGVAWPTVVLLATFCGMLSIRLVYTRRHVDQLGKVIARWEELQLQTELHADCLSRELNEFYDRSTRAIAVLDAAPDPASDEASKREAHAIQAANLHARTILAEGSEPPQRRGG